MIRLHRSKIDPYAALRRRMIRETELALTIGFRFPKRLPRIPTVEVGHGTFHPAFSVKFWQDVLELDEDTIETLQRVSGE